MRVPSAKSVLSLAVGFLIGSFPTSALASPDSPASQTPLEEEITLPVETISSLPAVQPGLPVRKDAFRAAVQETVKQPPAPVPISQLG